MQIYKYIYIYMYIFVSYCWSNCGTEWASISFYLNSKKKVPRATPGTSASCIYIVYR